MPGLSLHFPYLQRPTDGSLFSRFAPIWGLVTLRQIFVRRSQNCVAWAAVIARRRWNRRVREDEGSNFSESGLDRDHISELRRILRLPILISKARVESNERWNHTN
jgi:hypothetical protein